MKRMFIVLALLLCGCASWPQTELNENQLNYYYQRNKYPGFSDAETFYRQRLRIAENDYRILPEHIREMYKKVEGDECTEIHCPQF